MHLVQIGHGAVFIGQITNFGNRGDIAVHRIDGFKGDQLGLTLGQCGQLGLEIGKIIVVPDHLLRAGMADALDHRGMVKRVRQDHKTRNFRAKRAQRGPVRHISRGEQQRRLFVMQVCQFAFQHHMGMGCAADVAGAACPCADGVQRGMHGRQDIGVLPHAQIIVGTPDRHLIRFGPVVLSDRKIATLAFKFGKHTIVAVFFQALQSVLENIFVIHVSSPVVGAVRGPSPRTQWLSRTCRW